MNLTDIIALALRNLRQAKLRTALTVIGVVVGVAAIVTLVSFGLGLQKNILGQALSRLDVFTSITVSGASAEALLEINQGRADAGASPENSSAPEPSAEPGNRRRPRRALNDEAIAEIAAFGGVKYAVPVINFPGFVKFEGRIRRIGIGGSSVSIPDNPKFRKMLAGRVFSSDDAREAVVSDNFAQGFSSKWFQDRREGRPRNNGPFEPPTGKTEAEKVAEARQTIGREIVLLVPRADGGQSSPESIFGIPMLDLIDIPQGPGRDQQGDLPPGRNYDEMRFTIVGVFTAETVMGLTPMGGSRLILPMNVARRLRETNRDPMERLGEALAGESGYQMADVKVIDPTQVRPVMDRIEKMGLRAFSINTQMEEINRVFLIVNASLGLIGGIALLVASFGISNTMIMSIRERTREIGIMKAIGGTDGEIMRIFFVEASMIGLAGGALGVLSGWAVDRVANSLANTYIVKNAAIHVEFFSIPWYLAVGAVLFAMAISLVAAIYPALRAARVDPIRALRYE